MDKYVRLMMPTSLEESRRRRFDELQSKTEPLSMI
jgi:hypothetical protein